MPAFVFLGVLCLGAAGLLSQRVLYGPELPPQEGPPLPPPAEERVELPVYQPLRSEQEVVALRAREERLAEELLRDFPDDDNALMIKANLAYRHGDTVEAREFWGRALRANPSRSDAYVSMAWSSFKAEAFEEAIAYYRKALDLEPQLPGAHVNIGRALLMAGRNDEAIEELEKEIRVSKDSAFTYSLLGQAYLQQKDYARARENYEAALTIDPNHVNACYGVATACGRLDLRDEAKAYSARFRELKARAREDLKGRKTDFDDFSHTQKNAAITYIHAGRMYHDHGQSARAEQLLKEATGLDPQNVMGYLQLASLYQARRESAKAVQMYQRIVKLQPDAQIGHFMIGILSTYLKRFEEAERAFHRVIALAPTVSHGYCELARLYLKTGRKLPQARRLADRALALEPTAANYFIVAWAAYANGDMATALPAVLKAMELDPDNKNYPLLYQQMQQRKRK